MKRRRFMIMALAGLAGMARGRSRRRAAGRRRTAARYPGRVRSLDRAAVRRPGRWAG